jgi:hypothetical protein
LFFTIATNTNENEKLQYESKDHAKRETPWRDVMGSRYWRLYRCGPVGGSTEAGSTRELLELLRR